MKSLRVLVTVLLGACAAGSPGQATRPAGSPRVAEIVRAGEAQYWAGELDSARAQFQDGLAAAELAGDSLAKARTLTWLGLTAFRSGNLTEARTHGDAALALTSRIGDPEEVFRATNLLGLLAWRQGRLGEADTLFRRAMESARQANDEDGASRALGNLALVRVDRGEFAAARDGFEQMLATARKVGDRRIESNALRDLASLDLREGNLVSARERLVTARGLAQALGFVLGEVDGLTQLAHVYAATGDNPAAVAAADSAARMAESHDFVQEQAAALSVLAQLLGDLGSDQQALRILDSAQHLNALLDLPIERGGDLRRSAAILARLGRHEVAVHTAIEALRLHDSVGVGPERLADLLLLADIDPGHNDRWLRKARVLADSLRFPWARLDVGFAGARALLDRKDFAGALGVLTSLATEPRTGDFGEEWQYADLQAEADRGLGRLEEAEVAARRAVRFYDRVRQAVGPNWARARLMQAGLATRTRLVEILIARGDLAGAQGVADGVHELPGRSNLPATSSRGGIDGEVLLARIASLAQDLRALEDREEPGSPGAELQHRLLQTRDAYERLVISGSPTPTADTTSSGLARLQAVLGVNEVLLEYFLGPDQIHLFIITRAQISHRTLGTDPADLASRVRLARDLVARPESGPLLPPVLGRLFEILLGPAEFAPDGHWPARLTLVTPGFLAHLPFGALVDSRTGRYLVEQTELATTPSAAALVQLRTRRAGPGRAGRLVAFAPDSQSLPWTAREAREVAGSVPRGVALVGTAASEERFRLEATRAGILHLAAHAGLNPDNPLFSWIDLRTTGTAAGADGLLEVHEIPTIHAHLVFLSGCETALARGPGESPNLIEDDLATLAQAFLQAGSSEVIATLWRIPDASAAALAKIFYRRLTQESAASALARAQREILADPRTSTPYHWAAFELLGGSP